MGGAVKTGHSEVIVRIRNREGTLHGSLTALEIHTLKNVCEFFF